MAYQVVYAAGHPVIVASPVVYAVPEMTTRIIHTPLGRTERVERIQHRVIIEQPRRITYINGRPYIVIHRK